MSLVKYSLDPLTPERLHPQRSEIPLNPREGDGPMDLHILSTRFAHSSLIDFARCPTET